MRRLTSIVEPKRVQAEVEALERLDLGALRIQWRNRWGRLAPASLPRGLLYRVMAYRLQAETFGDLSRETVRLLDRLAKEAPAAPSEANASDNAGPDNSRHRGVGSPLAATTDEATSRGVGRSASGRDIRVPMVLKPGALLTREWQGRIERVMALETGFAWNGQAFASLSGVAFAITGVKWSGQRFFFGSARRNGSAAPINRPGTPSADASAVSRRAGSAVRAEIVGAPTKGAPIIDAPAIGSPPSSSAATSADRPNWRRNGKARERSLSWEPGR